MGIGFSKAGFPGVSMLHVVVFAMVFGSKPSTGVLLPMLIVGDLCAIAAFGRRGNMRQIALLLPPTLGGILIGWRMMSAIEDDQTFRWIVGGIILTLSSFQAYRMFAASRSVIKHGDADNDADTQSVDEAATNETAGTSITPVLVLLAMGLGTLAGVTTMLANAAGPVIALYLLMARLPKFELIGTSAWLFLTLNLCKVPLSYDLGLINPESLVVGVRLCLAIPIGMLAGRWLVSRISQTLFNQILLGFTIVMAIRLMI